MAVYYTSPQSFIITFSYDTNKIKIDGQTFTPPPVCIYFDTLYASIWTPRMHQFGPGMYQFGHPNFFALLQIACLFCVHHMTREGDGPFY